MYVCRFLIVKAVVGNFSKEKALVDQMPSPGTVKLREGPLPALLPAELGGPSPLPGAEVSPDPGDGEAGGQLPPHRGPAARRRVQPQQPRVEILLHLHTTS